MVVRFKSKINRVDMMKKVTCRFVVCLLVGLFCCCANAQQIVISLGPNNDGEEQFQELIDNMRGSALFQLNGRINDIKKNCNLTEKQLQKLRVAAKGAVAEFANEEEKTKREQLRRYQQQAGIDPDKKKKKKDDDDDDDDKGQFVRNFAFVMRVKPSVLIESSKLWKKSLDTILDDKQMELYLASKKERERFIRKAAVDQFVAEVDLKLFLESEQRTALTEVIDKKFGDKLVDAIRFADLNRNRGFIANNNKREPKYTKLVKDILSKEQLKEWVRSVEPRLDELSRIIRR